MGVSIKLRIFWWVRKIWRTASGGRGEPLPLKPLPHGGTGVSVSPNPLGNFRGLILRIASGATRGDAELEADRERFGLPVEEDLDLNC
jgi:hypothetical protein